MNNDKTFSWKNVVQFGGAYIAFCIGSGFASGQEIMQFFTSFGYWSIGAAAISFVLFTWFGGSIMETGNRLQIKDANSIFKYYCGNIIGTFLNGLRLYSYLQYSLL